MTDERDRLDRLAAHYRAFADEAALGNSPVYKKLALAVAEAPEMLRFIASFPAGRRQANLFLAAVRSLHGVPEDAGQLLSIVLRDREAIRRVILSHTTQTNEPARCAALVPLLAGLPQPLAIVEVGASAGLCLLPDRYGYDYGVARAEPPLMGGRRPPILACAASGPVPYPKALPQIVWRRGLDLNPIDVRADEETRWLEMLVWPGAGDRAATLRAAIEIARLDPPTIVRGDLRTDLAPLLAEAPRDATLVVFHTAVLAYVSSPAARERFVDTVRNAGAVWISNEAPNVFPAFAEHVPAPPSPWMFLLLRDGRPVAWTAPHGQSLHWFGTGG